MSGADQWEHGTHSVDTLTVFEERIAQAIESQPPTPPTFRGSLGATVERLVQRVLFWQYAQARQAQSALVSHLRAADATAANLQRQLAASQKRTLSLEDEVASLKRHIQQVERQLNHDSTEREKRYDAALSQVRSDVQQLTANDEARWLNENRPDLYLQFEDIFRGTQEDISERLRVYLPKLGERRIIKENDTIVDIGCGRGEWLSLLTEEGYRARGCDSNPAFVDVCRQNGLDVTMARGNDFLKSLEPASSGVISCMHVIEHLPFHVLLDMLDAIYRALRPGGVMILETPNALNAIVGFHNFYLDPTHRKPIPSALLRFLVESKGFQDVEVVPLHPHADWLRLPEDNETSKRYNEQFYGPQDYSLIAVRP